MAKGKLILVATPIGNPGDMSPRAREALSTADLVLCEDTRVTGLLLAELDLKVNLLSYHEHNAESRHPLILERLRAGETVVLVSDAGMPLISDPGERLVRLILAEGIPLSVIPGPNAALTALAASGLDSSRFVFEGFLPARGKERRTRLAELGTEPRSLILYEAPHRLLRTLTDLAAMGLGERRISIGRELTKKYEEYLYFTVAEAKAQYTHTMPRGEFVLILEGRAEFESRRPIREQSPAAAENIDDLIRERLAAGGRLRQIAQEIAELTGWPANTVYERILQLRKIKPEKPRLRDSDSGI